MGLWAIASPSKIEAFVSIKGIGKEGVSEVRATYGGFFVGVAFCAMVTQTPAIFIALGCGWLSAAVVRLGTLLFGFYTPKNVVGTMFEAAIGSLCITPLFT